MDFFQFLHLTSHASFIHQKICGPLMVLRTWVHLRADVPHIPDSALAHFVGFTAERML